MLPAHREAAEAWIPGTASTPVREDESFVVARPLSRRSIGTPEGGRESYRETRREALVVVRGGGDPRLVRGRERDRAEGKYSGAGGEDRGKWGTG